MPERRPGRKPAPGPGRAPAGRRVPAADILVIGAGAVGAAAASALARAGRSVRVLSHASRSTTAVSGGHLLLQSKCPGPVLDLARRSLELLAAFAAGREEDLSYRRSGSFILAASEEEDALLRHHFETLADAGVPLEWLHGDAVRRLEPEVAPEVRAASFCPTDAQVHPGRLAAAWLFDAVEHGASVTSGAPVEGFVTTGGAVSGAVAGGTEYAASAVVLAAGPWSGELAAMAGASVAIEPRRGLLLRANPGRPVAARPLLGAEYLVSKFSEDACSVACSFQQHPDGECVLGGSREFAGFDASPPAELAEAVLACGSRYLPVLRSLEWTDRQVAFRPWTPDGRPRIGPSGVPGLYLACGHEGDGITLAAATAELLVSELAQSPR